MLAFASNQLSLAAKLHVNVPDFQEFHDLNVCGHRGSLYNEPENTVQGFRHAANLGCDSVELDVFLLKDDKLVVFHGGGDDKNPGQTNSYFGVEGSILDYNYEEVQHLHLRTDCEELACPKDKLSTAYVPLLEEVLLDAKKSGIYVKIELKGPKTEVPTLELVERLGMIDQCSFASFDHKKVAKIRALRPEKKLDGSYRYITGCLYSDEVPDNFVEDSIANGASEVHLKYDTCTKERVASIHQKGLRSMAWFRGPIGMKEDISSRYLDVGNEDELMYRTLLSTCVMSLCVNKPDVLLSLLARVR